MRKHSSLAWLFRAPVFDDFQRTRNAEVLHWVLLSGVITLALLFIFSPVFNPNPASTWAAYAAAMVVIGVALWLTHRGRERLAGIVFTALIWLLVTVSTWFLGGMRAPAILAYPVLVLVAGFIWSAAAAIGIAAVSLVATFFIVWAESRGLAPTPPGPITPGRLWATLAAMLFVTASLLFLALRRIQAALGDFRATFEQAAVGVAHVDFDGHFLRTNRKCAEILGYQAAELRGVRVWDVTAPEDHESDVEDLRRLVRGQVDSIKRDKRLLRKDGRVVDGRATASLARDAEGHPEYVIIVFEDVTEHKNAETRIRRNLALFEAVVEGTADFVFVKDREGRFLLSNSGFAQEFGLSKQELIGKTDFALADRERAMEFRAVDQEIMQTGESRNFEHAVDWGHGRKIYLTTKTPWRDADGSVLGVIGVSRDITERNERENALARSHRELRDLASRLQMIREEERGAMAREIHDELGQALTALKMDLVWILERLPESAATLRRRGATMVSLIDGTVEAVQRLSSRLRPPLLDDLGVGAAIEWQAQEFASRSGIPCALHLEPIDDVLGEPESTALFRIFQEALTNVARHAHARHLEVTLRQLDEEIVLTVRDDGQGIHPAAVESPDSLGLIGMRERAENFGGTIAVASVDGVGTSVTVRMPAAVRLSGRTV